MKAKKIIIPIVIVLVILATLGGVFAFLWFKTSLLNFLKPSEDVFADQIKKAFNLEDAKFSDYSESLKKYKDLSDKPVKAKLNVTAKLNISELDDEVEEVVNKSKLTIESNADIKNKKSQNKIGLYSNNSEVLTLDMVTNDGKVGVGCKDLSDKYLAFSINDLIDYIKKDGSMDEEELKMLSKIASGDSINPYDLLYVSDEDLKHFDEEYSVNKILDLISKDCFSKENSVEIEVDGDTVKASKSSLTLTGADAYKFAEDLSNKLKDDSVVTKLVTEKANMLLEYAGQDKISEEDVKDLMDKLFGEMLDELEGLKDEKDSAVQIAIYSKSNKPVRIDVNMLEDVEDSDSETLLSIEYAKNKDIYTIYNDGKAYISIVNDYEKKEKEQYKGKLTAKAQGTSIGTLDYEIVNKDKESKVYLDLSIPLANVSAKVDISSNGDYNKEPVKINGLINFKYNKESAEIKFDGTVEYGDVSIPELNSSNSIDVLKLSEEESKTELDKILKKASEVLPARLKLIGIDVKAEDIYKEKVEVPETTNNDDIQNAIDDAQKIIDSVDTTSLSPELQNQLKQIDTLQNQINL